MIDPKELRIGNIVKDRGGKAIRVDFLEHIQDGYNTKFGQLVFLEGTEVHPMTEYSDYANPIPLTHEILLKTGFQYDETDEQYTICSIDFEASEEDVDRHFSLWSENKEDFECYFADIPIKSVHQLQNLYFALTGEELEIKL